MKQPDIKVTGDAEFEVVGDEQNIVFNRRQRRLYRRAVLGEHRKATRFWRGAWRGILPQWQVAAIVIGMQKHAQLMDAEYEIAGTA